MNYYTTNIAKIYNLDGSFIWETKLYKHTISENGKAIKLVVSIESATKTEATNARYDILKNYKK